ncbi:ABC transporter permease subunit [Ornithinibacillus sp. 4-3]|uniref:ABC transporter permease subunit n=1 Tax=Ornithinibacillus sp. 4-3 TaxID=3231488 RepID=A0AB39HS85_9BACI
MHKGKIETKVIFIAIIALFLAFLALPLLFLFVQSFSSEEGFAIKNYLELFESKEITAAFLNSIKISAITATITTTLAFALAYTVNVTRVFSPLKKVIRTGIMIPMLLPTITYGFAIIYSFGNQGLITKLFGQNLFDIYGFNGLLIGYVIYTLPSAFLLIHNSFTYMDKKFIIVSKLMGDGPVRGFINTILRPLVGTLGGAFVLSFILSFTDFGIPASIGGTYEVVATELYRVMLGAIPNFDQGAAIAVLMLLPAVFGIILLRYLDKFQFHYDKVGDTEVLRHRGRDILFGSISVMTLIAIVSVFVVMLVAPLVESYPYNMSFTWKHFSSVFTSNDLVNVYQNSLLVAGLTAVFGTIIAYGAALLNIRTKVKGRGTMDIISMITNTVPGMVLGLSYLLFFNESSLKGTFIIIILSTIVHYFTTPYLMAKNSLAKMNPSWETTGELLGDSWLKTIRRVVLPNSISTVLEMFSYYFINAMVTISGLIFLVTAETSVVASKIKELQHFAQFNDIFVLSILIFGTNLAMRLVCDGLQKIKIRQKTKTKLRSVA